ncbi:hypothetical protein G6683_01795 [Polynucleobacter paneuropaeus]|nr:hypothetical protein [Polynucleobacter paneuropaeus]
MNLLKLNRVAFFVLSAFFVLATGFIYFSPHSLVPDEIGFLKIGSNYSYLKSPNPEYFGAIFWLLISTIENWLVLRFLFFLMYLASFILIIKSTQLYKSNLSSFAPLFILSSPIFLWTGKLIDPEFINFFLISLVIYALHNRAVAISGILLGVSLGIKIDSLAIFPAALFLLYLNSLDFKKFTFGVVKISIFTMFGLIISNPLNIKQYLTAVFSKSHAVMSEFSENLYKLLFSQLWTWDAIQYTGFFSYIISLPSLILFLILLYYINLNIFILFIVAFIPSIFLIGHTQNVFIWYFIPFITFFIYCFFSLISSIEKFTFNNPGRYYFIYILFISILANIYIFSDISVSKLHSRYLLSSHKSLLTYQNNLIGIVNLSKPKLIVNYSDINVPIFFSITIIEGDTRWESFKFLENIRTILDGNNALEQNKLCIKIHSYQRILFIFDKRLSYNSDIFDSDNPDFNSKIIQYINRIKFSCKFDSQYHINVVNDVYFVDFIFIQ